MKPMTHVAPQIALLAALGILTFGAPNAWPSQDPPDARMGPEMVRATCAPNGALAGVADSIRTSSSLGDARALAIEHTALARTALANARWVTPGDLGDVDQAHSAILAYQERVAAAQTPAEVADEFTRTFVQPGGMLGGIHADVDVDVEDGGCDYSGGEIIATVLGFILGIIPGIILLILLC